MGIWTSLAKMVSYPFRHPCASVKAVGGAAKTGAVGAGVAYVGWEKMTTDKSVVRIVGDAVIGEETIDKVEETVSDVKGLKDSAVKAVDTVSDAMTDVNSKWSGMTKFFRGLFGGNGLDMFGNFFRNIGNGNVSGLSIAGLVVAAFMIFGRFGFLGKIAGAMLGMTMIGNNSSLKMKNTNREFLSRQQEESSEQQSRGRRV